MSTVFLHVGQCGNQVGQSFWGKVDKDQSVKDGMTFLHNDGYTRSVHVDSEPKVLQKLLKSGRIREKNVICGRRGRGSNWALGYYGLKHQGDNHLVEDSMEALRKEIERCNCYSGCIMMHSLSGGTGSGLGSRLCETIRDEYPMNYLTSCVFAPCQSGESPLQHFNSLLTLAKLQTYTDCIIVTQNDDILEALQKKRQSVAFSHINNEIASSLCGVFLPTDCLTPKSGRSIGMEPWELLRSITPMPQTKFVHLNHVCHSKLTWENLMSKLLSRARRFNSEGKSFGCLENVVVARGDSGGTFLRSMKSLERKVKSVYKCVDWNPYPVDVWTAKSNPLGPVDSASITVAANHGIVIDFLERVVKRSKVMYDSEAYLHWYWKYGAIREDFENSFETLSTVVADYVEALSS